jgi:hypothetical protein
MRFLVTKQSNDLSQSFTRLLQVIKEDREINTRVIQLLNLDPFVRRLLLNKWLERLRRRQAPESLLQALSLLFEDSTVEQTLKVINIEHKNNQLNNYA